MVFAHGFGCDQNLWRYVAPAFEGAFRRVLFDYIGSGGTDIVAYDRDKYASRDGDAEDVVALGRALDIADGVFVGHSVSAMIGVLAVKRAPELFSTLVLVKPPSRYIDGDGTLAVSASIRCWDLSISSTAIMMSASRGIAAVNDRNLSFEEYVVLIGQRLGGLRSAAGIRPPYIP